MSDGLSRYDGDAQPHILIEHPLGIGQNDAFLVYGKIIRYQRIVTTKYQHAILVPKIPRIANLYRSSYGVINFVIVVTTLTIKAQVLRPGFTNNEKIIFKNQ